MPTVTLTSGTLYTVPVDCRRTRVQCVGTGSNGGAGQAGNSDYLTGALIGGRGGGGGGGGDYAEKWLELTPGTTVSYAIGSSSGLTWFVSTSTVAARGANAIGSTIGDVVHSGGRGGYGGSGQSGGSGYGGGGGGGGGAGGPSGNGLNGSPGDSYGGGGAGGAGGGSPGGAGGWGGFGGQYGGGSGGSGGSGAAYGSGGGGGGGGQGPSYGGGSGAAGTTGAIILTYTPYSPQSVSTCIIG